MKIVFPGLLVLPAVLLILSCSNPASSSSSSGSGLTATADSNKIGFEGAGLAACYAQESDVTGGTMTMVFAYDANRKAAGSQSLGITGTSQQNAYYTDFFGEVYINLADTSLKLSPADFTGKTITCSVYVPSSSGVSAVGVTLLNSSGLQEQLNQVSVTPGQWNTLSFSCAATNVNYADTGATFTDIKQLRFRFETGTASSAIAVNLDAVNW